MNFLQYPLLYTSKWQRECRFMEDVALKSAQR